MYTSSYRFPAECGERLRRTERGRAIRKIGTTMKEKMRKEGRTVDGKRERQEKVSRERKERGFQRLTAESHLQLSFTLHVQYSFSFVCQSAGHKHNSYIQLQLRLSLFGSQLILNIRMARCSCAANLVALWLCL